MWVPSTALQCVSRARPVTYDCAYQEVSMAPSKAPVNAVEAALRSEGLEELVALGDRLGKGGLLLSLRIWWRIFKKKIFHSLASGIC